MIHPKEIQGNIYFIFNWLYQSVRFETRNTFCGTWYLPHSRVHKSIAELCSNFGDSAITKGQIAYFLVAHAQNGIFLLPVKNLTSPSCSPTPISYNTREFWRFGHKYGANCICVKFGENRQRNETVRVMTHGQTDRQTDRHTDRRKPILLSVP